jgi:NADH-quinone oxidoreductase subunit G
MATVYIEDRGYETPGGDNLLQTCLSLGFDLPYFCWHPAMGSVGACRQCAVKQYSDENDHRGRIVMACMTPAADGTRISIADPQAAAFRSRVIEWLMTNHPHDCPVCEEGGECHLQDMTVMTGHAYRRYRFDKRTFRNQNLGPFINHEMNRCIACYRCVRFYEDYAGGRDLHAFASHNHVYFGRFEDGVLESEFSGNLAEVCPTGVFTDKTLGRFYNRKWDLRAAPSVCVHCGLGCNTTPNERHGKVRRILNRYNGEVNGYFLCDRGRFGYGFVDSAKRLRRPLLRPDADAQAVPTTREGAINHLAALLSSGKAIGIGSPRASLEANFALRTLVGAEHFHLGLGAQEHAQLALIIDILRRGPAPAASLKQAEQADAVLVLGENVPNTAPRLALSLRQAVRGRTFELARQRQVLAWQDSAVRDVAQRQRSPLFVATPVATRLDDVAALALRAVPDDVARLGFAVASEIDASAPRVPKLPELEVENARTIAEALHSARRPLIVSGTGCASAAAIEAAANIAWALHRAGRKAALNFSVSECNSLGLGLIGGSTLADALAALEGGRAETLVALENDLYRRADRASVDRALDRARHVVVLDHVMTDTAARAELALPAATFAEGDGTLVSGEGRAQRFFQVFKPEDDVRESWRWLHDGLAALGRAPEPRWAHMDDVTAACAAVLPVLEPIPRAAPGADFRVTGSRIRREPHRCSGRTAIDADRMVREPPPPKDRDAPFSFSMEGAYGTRLPSALIPFFWAPSWNSIQAVNKFQGEVGGALRGGNPGIRLIEPAADAKPAYFGRIPKPFVRRRNAWLILPLHEIFGSEELSRLAPAVAERVPAPYLALNPKDAERLHGGDGAAAVVRVGDASCRLALHLLPSLQEGAAGVPIGLAGSFAISLPAWGEVSVVAGERG